MHTRFLFTLFCFVRISQCIDIILFERDDKSMENMKSETDVTKNVFDSDSELIFNYFKMSANTIFSFFVEY